jgi:hypothetical protein
VLTGIVPSSSVVASNVLFVSRPDPFAPTRVVCQYPAGLSIDEALARSDVYPRRGAPLAVLVDGELVKANRWSSTILVPGQIVQATHVPRWALLVLVFKIVLAALPAGLQASWVGVAIAATVAAGVAVGVSLGVSMLLSLAINAIVGKPDQPNNDQSLPDQSPTFQGTGNRAFRNGPVWRVLGEHRVVFPYAALPFTEVVSGNQQVLRMLLTAGYGPVDISDLKIGDTPIDNYDGVDYQVHDGASASPAALSLFSQDVKQDDLAVEFKLSGFTVITPFGQHAHVLTDTADEIGIDLLWPGGQYYMTGSGNRRSYSIDLLVEVRRTDPTPGAWTNLYDITSGSEFRTTSLGTKWVSEYHPGVPFPEGNRLRVKSSRNELSWLALHWPVHAGRGTYEIRVSAFPWGYGDGGGPTNPPSGITIPSAQMPNNRNGSYQFPMVADFRWATAKAIKHQNPVRMGNVSLIELRIKATDQLSGVLQNLNGLVKSKHPIWDGATWSAPTLTRNPAWIYAETLRGVANKNPVPDARIDKDQLLAFADYCEPTPGTYLHTYDRVVDFDTDVKQIGIDILATASASPHLSSGTHTVIIDKARTTPTQHFTPRNVSNYTYSRPFIKRPHAIKVKFMNSAVWQPDEIPVYDDGYGLNSCDTGAGGIDMEVDGGTQIVTRNDVGDFVADGFTKNTWATLSGFTDSANNGTFLIKSVNTSTLEFYGTALQTEVASAGKRAVTLAALTFETVELPGVVEAVQLWRFGRLKYAFSRLRAEIHSFDVDWEYLVCERGDLVKFSHYVLEMGSMWGRVEEVSLDSGGNVEKVRLDAELTYENGKSYGIVSRMSDGTTHSAGVDNPSTSDDVVDHWYTYTTPPAPGSSAAVGDLVTFGEASLETLEMVIVLVQPRENLTARVFCQAHAPTAFDELDIAAVAPIIDSDVQEPEPEDRLAPLVPIILTVQALPADSETATAGNVRVRVEVQNPVPDPPAGDDDLKANVGAQVGENEIQYRLAAAGGFDASDWILVTSDYLPVFDFVLHGTSLAEDTVSIELRARAKSIYGVYSDWSTPLTTFTVRDLTVSKVAGISHTDSFIETARDGAIPAVNLVWQLDDTSERVSGWDVKILRNGTLYQRSFVIRTELQLVEPPEGAYVVEIRSVGYPSGLSEMVSYSFSYVPKIVRVSSIPAPRGMRVLGSDGSVGTYDGTDFTIAWEPVTIGVVPDLGDDTPTDAKPRDLLLKGYLVEVLDAFSNEVKRETEVFGETFTYTLSMNLEDNDGTATRYVRFRIRAIDNANQLGRTALFNVRNNPPRLPRLLSAAAESGQVILKLDASNIIDPDFEGVIVWRKIGSVLDDADLVEDNVVYKGSPIETIAFNLLTGSNYFRFAAYDAFSQNFIAAELNVSGNLLLTSAAGGLIGSDDIADDAVAKVTEVLLQDIDIFTTSSVEGTWYDVVQANDVTVVGAQSGGASLVNFENVMAATLDHTHTFDFAGTLESDHWDLYNPPMGIFPTFTYRIQQRVSDPPGAWTTIFPPAGAVLDQTISGSGYGIGFSDSFGVLINPGTYDFKVQVQWNYRLYTEGLARYRDSGTPGTATYVEGSGTAWMFWLQEEWMNIRVPSVTSTWDTIKTIRNTFAGGLSPGTIVDLKFGVLVAAADTAASTVTNPYRAYEIALTISTQVGLEVVASAEVAMLRIREKIR